MNNMEIYNAVAIVPEEAKKNIQAGRLKGKTEINPMWRIKKLTELFGACGIGWYTEIIKERLEDGAQGEKVISLDINLYYKYGDEWSKGVYGTGACLLVTNEQKGLRTDDDAYKKAYTDAISVACKALGIGASVYYEKDVSKYDAIQADEEITQAQCNELHVIRLYNCTQTQYPDAEDWKRKLVERYELLDGILHEKGYTQRNTQGQLITKQIKRRDFDCVKKQLRDGVKAIMNRDKTGG